MAFDTIVLVAAFMAVFAFLWNLHRDMGALRRDMNRNMEGLRQDMNRNLGALRQDMNRNLGALRRDMNRGIGGLRQDIGDLRDRVSRVEGMLAGARLKISPDPASG